jgi:hypothetical protein
MNIIEIAHKLGEFLNGRTIYFDHKSYDLEEDIPHIIIDGKRENVHTAQFNEDGSTLIIVTDSYEYTLGFYEDEDTTTEEILKEADEMGLYDLFSDIFYETEESWEIGDFELDFLGI